jgi:DNA (cytosine-5)-methyltransferase 3A
MKVLSLFDGMGCLGIALKDLGVEFNYYTSEIDKHAIAQSKLNFPNSIQLGDVTKWREWDLDWSKIDVIGAGSPCQGFSFAGKQLAFDDPRSALFFVFVEILEHIKKHNPNVIFLLENVKMKKEHELVITKYMGVAPIVINAALLSAQNRVRLFWTNIASEPYGLFGDMQCRIPQPEDRGILLKDILETNVPEKYYLSDKMLNYITKESPDNFKIKHKFSDLFSKSFCLTTKHDQRAGITNYIKTEKQSDYIVASRGCNHENPKSRKAGLPTEQQLEPRTDGKTNCITSVQKDNLVIQLNPSTESGGKQPYQQNRVYDTNGKNPALCSGQEQWGGNAVLQNDYRIRRLTPTECSRLQSIPEWYKWECSDTQAYKMLGNGWNVEVIKHILKNI